MRSFGRTDMKEAKQMPAGPVLAKANRVALPLGDNGILVKYTSREEEIQTTQLCTTSLFVGVK